MRKGKGIISLVLAAMIALFVMAAAGTAAAEGLPKEYTYHFKGTKYPSESEAEWKIAVFTEKIAAEFPELGELIMDADGFLKADYNYEWELSAEAEPVGYTYNQNEDCYERLIKKEDANAALGLEGRTVFTLTISKNGGAVMAKVKCVLESLVYGAEWENHQEIVEEIEFTPGKPITISLPQDRIASTGDNATLIYEWGRDLGDYDETYGSGKGLTSITFTPDAGWDENFVYAYVYREDLPDQLFDLGIEYELKISSTTGSGTTGSAPKTGDETPLALLVSLAAVSAGACLLLLRRRHA